MQCSPANTAVQLTKPWGSAKPTDLRKTNPDKIAYVRVATTDDNQGSGMADIAYNTIGAKSVYVLDDTQTYGKGLADAFTNTFTKFGGTLLKRDGVSDKTTDFTSYVTTAKGLNPAVVAYGGVTTKEKLLALEGVRLGEAPDAPPRLPAQLHGRVLLIDFWGIGCGPCVASLPGVQRAADEFRPKADPTMPAARSSAPGIRCP